MPLGLDWIGSISPLTIHIVLFFSGAKLMPASTLTFSNPGVTASIATLLVVPLLLLISLTIEHPS